MPAFGLSLMPEPGFARASLPLFESGTIDAVEWSFDMGWHPAGVPSWLNSLLNDYSAQGALVGHGVSYSLLGATGSHDRWLSLLRDEVEARDYQWISEHIGFVGAGRFSFSAPLPMPLLPDVVGLGQARLVALKDAAGCDVGVENLATCLGPDDATNQAELINQLLAPIDGFMVLDLHNLYCQSHNVGLDPIKLMARLPLDRVREVHVSGGSWSTASASERSIRRDTHDGLVPDAVLDLLGVALMRCVNLELVIYERLGNTFADPNSDEAYRADVRRVATVVAAAGDSPSAPPAPLSSGAAIDGPSDEDRLKLATYQASLLDVLARTRNGKAIKEALADAELSWATPGGGFDDDLLEVASILIRTWGHLVTE